MRDQFKTDTRFNCTGLVGEGWSFVHMQMVSGMWANDRPSPLFRVDTHLGFKKPMALHLDVPESDKKQ